MPSEEVDKPIVPVSTAVRKAHVVILVHGIRDHALWQSTIRACLEKEGFEVELTNYDRLDLFRFLLPIELFRTWAIGKIWDQIEHARKRHPGAVYSIIAHSFGTYIVAEILRRKFMLQLERVIFCGSVVRYDFPFEHIDSRFRGQIINEIGTADPWPALAESVTTGYGSAGTFGFRRPGVRDRWHNDFSHDDFLVEKFCKTFWIPRLLAVGDNDGIVEGDTEPKPPPLWVRLINIFKVKYFISAAVIALFVIWVLRAAFGWSPSYSLGQDDAKVFYWNLVITQMARDAGAVCPLPQAICNRPKLSLLLTQRRFATVSEFDEKLKSVFSCRNFRWRGRDPTAALESFAEAFPRCVRLTFDEGARSYALTVRDDGLAPVNGGQSLSCGCP